jgi:hypothetical protein
MLACRPMRPWSHPGKVLHTLDRTVGRDGFHVTVAASALNLGGLGAMDLKVLDPMSVSSC